MLLRHSFWLLVTNTPLCVRTMTPASPTAKGVSRVSQSGRSCRTSYDRLFVKLVAFVCSHSPPPPCLTVSPLWIWRSCFVLLAHTHTHTPLPIVCWLTCPTFSFSSFSRFSRNGRLCHFISFGFINAASVKSSVADFSPHKNDTESKFSVITSTLMSASSRRPRTPLPSLLPPTPVSNISRERC